MHFATITTRLTHDDHAIYRSSIPELEIDAYGDTAEEALTNLQEVCRAQMENLNRLGKPVPQPHPLSGLVSVGIGTDLGVTAEIPIPQPQVQAGHVVNPLRLGPLVFA